MTESEGRPVIWSSDARSDLSEIWDYYFKVAGRVREEVRPGLRSIAASPHVVFYRVRDEAAAIIRVLDGRRDLDDIFMGDG